MILTIDDITNLETRYRANFINSIGGFKSLALIGTKSLQQHENLAIFSSLFHLGANPAICGMVIRPNEEKENTLGNIVATGQYTINHVLPHFYRKAHQCSAKYAEGVSEFKEVGLTPQYLDNISAPFVQESNVKFACELVEKIDMTINNTFLILGKIIKIVVPDEFIGADGFVDLESAGTITSSGLDSYHTTRQISRLDYAKVNS